MPDQTAIPEEFAGIHRDRLRPRPDGSVLEYDPPFFIETARVGRHQNPDARCVRIHEPNSEVAEAVLAYQAERDKPRPATRRDAHMHDEVALLYECIAHDAREHGQAEKAEHNLEQARRHNRRASMIRRHLNWREHAPQTIHATSDRRPVALAAPRERRECRTSSPSRAGPDDDSESSEPPRRRLCENPRCGADISHLHPLRKYCDNDGACKQAAYRDRQRDWNPDVPAGDPYFRFDPYPPRRFEDLRKRIEDGCRCNGQHIADGEDRHCIKCGHRRGAAAPYAGFLSALSAETRRPRKAVV